MARTVLKPLPPDEARTRFFTLGQEEQQQGCFSKAAELFELAHAWGDAAANYGRMGNAEKEAEMWGKAKQDLGKK